MDEINETIQMSDSGGTAGGMTDTPYTGPRRRRKKRSAFGGQRTRRKSDAKSAERSDVPSRAASRKKDTDTRKTARKNLAKAEKELAKAERAAAKAEKQADKAAKKAEARAERAEKRLLKKANEIAEKNSAAITESELDEMLGEAQQQVQALLTTAAEPSPASKSTLDDGDKPYVGSAVEQEMVRAADAADMEDTAPADMSHSDFDIDFSIPDDMAYSYAPIPDNGDGAEDQGDYTVEYSDNFDALNEEIFGENGMLAETYGEPEQPSEEAGEASSADTAPMPYTTDELDVPSFDAGASPYISYTTLSENTYTEDAPVSDEQYTEGAAVSDEQYTEDAPVSDEQYTEDIQEQYDVGETEDAASDDATEDNEANVPDTDSSDTSDEDITDDEEDGSTLFDVNLTIEEAAAEGIISTIWQSDKNTASVQDGPPSPQYAASPNGSGRFAGRFADEYDPERLKEYADKLYKLDQWESRFTQIASYIGAALAFLFIIFLFIWKIPVSQISVEGKDEYVLGVNALGMTSSIRAVNPAAMLKEVPVGSGTARTVVYRIINDMYNPDSLRTAYEENEPILIGVYGSDKLADYFENHDLSLGMANMQVRRANDEDKNNAEHYNINIGRAALIREYTEKYGGELDSNMKSLKTSPIMEIIDRDAVRREAAEAVANIFSGRISSAGDIPMVITENNTQQPPAEEWVEPAPEEQPPEEIPPEPAPTAAPAAKRTTTSKRTTSKRTTSKRTPTTTRRSTSSGSSSSSSGSSSSSQPAAEAPSEAAPAASDSGSSSTAASGGSSSEASSGGSSAPAAPAQQPAAPAAPIAPVTEAARPPANPTAE